MTASTRELLHLPLTVQKTTSPFDLSRSPK
jgi:hypothetical protein